MINLRAEINKVETRKTIQKIKATKSWFFEKINKIDKPLSKLTKKQRENMKINKIKHEKGNITLDTNESQPIFRPHFENMYSTKYEKIYG